MTASNASEKWEDPDVLDRQERFLRDGYVIDPAGDRTLLDRIRSAVCTIVCGRLGVRFPDDPGAFLEEIHHSVKAEDLNPLRMAVFQEMNAHDWIRPAYYKLARQALDEIVGNELAMQAKVNFSVQMPGDESSVLGIHSDCLSGETPFQVVVWIPLVKVEKTKSMFLLAPEHSAPALDGISELTETGMSGLYPEYEDRLQWLSIDYGQVMVFSPILLHGNTVNREATTRWSMNCRFTGLFTPYTSDQRGLGNFYLPITPKPASRLGMSFRMPGGFETGD